MFCTKLQFEDNENFTKLYVALDSPNGNNKIFELSKGYIPVNISNLNKKF